MIYVKKRIFRDFNIISYFHVCMKLTNEAPTQNHRINYNINIVKCMLAKQYYLKL